MTVKDIYEQTIKPLLANDRAALADLILDDLGSEPPNTFESESALVAVLVEGMRERAIPVTAGTWAKTDPMKTNIPLVQRSQEQDVLMTRQEAAAYTGLSLPTLHRYVQKGKLTIYKRGPRRAFFSREEIHALAQPVAVKSVE